MRRFISKPKPDRMVILTIHDGIVGRGHGEYCYDISVFEIGEFPLETGMPLKNIHQVSCRSLVKVVEVLVANGHKNTDDMIRFATN